MPIPYPRQNPSRAPGRGYRPPARPMPTPNARTPLLPVAVPPGAGLGLKMAGRLVPLLGLALLAYDLYQLYKWYQGRGVNIDYSKFIQSCTGGGTHFSHGTIFNCGDTFISNGAPGHSAYLGWPNSYYGNKYDSDASWVLPGYEFWKLTDILTPIGPQATPDSVVVTYGSPQEYAAPTPEEIPAISPWIAPVIDPFSTPIQQPMPEMPQLPYWALPLRVPNPWRSPHEQPQRGYIAPTPLEVPNENPWPSPAVAPNPARWLAPVTVPPLMPSAPGVPGPTITISPKGEVKMEPPPAKPPTPKPPGKGVVETKQAVKGANTVWKLANANTEARDFIREVWKGIDPRWRAQKNPQLWRIKGWKPRGGTGSKFAGPKTSLPTIQKMAKDIYDAALDGKMDWNKALDNVIKDQLQDYFYGKMGRKAAEGNRKVQTGPYGTRRPTGWGSGPLHGQI